MRASRAVIVTILFLQKAVVRNMYKIIRCKFLVEWLTLGVNHREMKSKCLPWTKNGTRVPLMVLLEQFHSFIVQFPEFLLPVSSADSTRLNQIKWLGTSFLEDFI